MSSQGTGTSPLAGHTPCEQRQLFAAFSLHRGCDRPGFGAQIYKRFPGWLQGGLTPLPGLHASSQHCYRLSHPSRSLSPTHTQTLQNLSPGHPRDHAAMGDPRQDIPPAKLGPEEPGCRSWMPAWLQRLLAVPEAGCPPGDGSGRLHPEGEQAGAGLGGVVKGRAIPHSIWPQHGAKATAVMVMVIQCTASGARMRR